MKGYGRKKKEFWRNKANVGLLGKVIKILLTFFNKDIEMFLINRSLMK